MHKTINPPQSSCLPETAPSDIIIPLVGHALRTKTVIIIGYDANTHHNVWGNCNIIARGADPLQFLINTDLEILNKENEPIRL